MTDLQIHSVFYSIQGEGPLSGMPAMFIRLAGCNLRCPMCDTNHERKYEALPYDLARDIHGACVATDSPKIAVITGGEPLLQDQVYPLIQQLTDAGFRVQVETNGTIAFSALALDTLSKMPTIVCSPKTPEINIHPEHVHSYKYVLAAGMMDEDGLPLDGLGYPERPARPPEDFPRTDVFVMPRDDYDEQKNKANVEVAVTSCLRFGYRLGIQLHKLIGLD